LRKHAESATWNVFLKRHGRICYSLEPAARLDWQRLKRPSEGVTGRRLKVRLQNSLPLPCNFPWFGIRFGNFYPSISAHFLIH
jgi:hypothetical protein